MERSGSHAAKSATMCKGALRARIIHYEITDTVEVGRLFGKPRETSTSGLTIALLRCISSRNEKITVACPEEVLQHLMADDKATDRGTFAVSESFPLRWNGWADPIESAEAAA